MGRIIKRPGRGLNLNTVFLFFLPFTQALTIDFFFPLKISEIALVLIILFYLNKKIISGASIWFFKDNKVIFFLMLLVTASFILNISWNYGYMPKKVPFRISRVGDSFIRLCYFYLCIAAYFISFRIFSRNIKYLNIWIAGAVVATLYGWYIFVSSAFHIPYLKLPGMELEPQNLNGIIRCGTFKEGNYFGLFLVLSSAIAFYMNKPRPAWFLMLSVVMTFSTVSLFSGFILIVYYYRRNFFKLRKFIKLSPLLILAVIVFVNTKYFDRYVYSKVSEPVSRISRHNYSKVERTITGDAAFYSGINNPFFGVGPANYGLHYDHYNHFRRIIKNSNWYVDMKMTRKNERVIANNVYLEIWSEYGVSGFCLFAIFLLTILWKAIRLKEDAITGGMVALMISINAFPSFIMFFLWVFFSLPSAIQWQRMNMLRQNTI